MSGTASPIKIEESNPVRRILSFDIPWTTVSEELDMAYKRIGKKAKIKGFRAGKIPRKVLEIYYKDQAEDEAVSNIVTKYYSDAIRENDINPVDKPIIEQGGINHDQDFQFTATVEVEPVVDPQDYMGIKIEKRDIKVTAQDITERIDQIREIYSTLEEVKEDRPVKKDDFVTIDFTGNIDGKVQKELTSDAYTLQIGSKSFFGDFEERLVGVKKGDEKEIRITLPENFHLKKAAGKECVFSVSVKDIRERILPKIDKNFLKNFEKYETIKDFEEDVKKSIEDEEKRKVESEVESQLIDRIIEKNDFQVPEAYVERQIYIMMLNAQNHLVNNGMKSEEAIKISSKMHDNFKDQAEKTVKASILLSKISEKESITFDGKELEERMSEIGTRVEASQRDAVKERMRDEMVTQKTIDYLVEHANIKKAGKNSPKGDGKE